jgi:hypothetical protein
MNNVIYAFLIQFQPSFGFALGQFVGDSLSHFGGKLRVSCVFDVREV